MIIVLKGLCDYTIRQHSSMHLDSRVVNSNRVLDDISKRGPVLKKLENLIKIKY